MFCMTDGGKYRIALISGHRDGLWSERVWILTRQCTVIHYFFNVCELWWWLDYTWNSKCSALIEVNVKYFISWIRKEKVIKLNLKKQTNKLILTVSLSELHQHHLPLLHTKKFKQIHLNPTPPSQNAFPHVTRSSILNVSKEKNG